MIPKEVIDAFRAELMSSRMSFKDALFEAQKRFGYLSKDVMYTIADVYKVPPAHLYGFATFFKASFRFEPPAEVNVYVCTGSQCYLNGAEDLLRMLKEKYGVEIGKVRSDGKISLKQLKCLKTCCKPPVVVVNDEVMLETTPDTLDSKLRGLGVREVAIA